MTWVTKRAQIALSMICGAAGCVTVCWELKGLPEGEDVDHPRARRARARARRRRMMRTRHTLPKVMTHFAVFLL